MTVSTFPQNARLLEGIVWGRETTKIENEILWLLVASSLVESRGDLYGYYLSRVFSDDPEFEKEIVSWSVEENEHGAALGAWLNKSNEKFDLGRLLAKYNESVPLSYQGSQSSISIRGSKAAELLSRCAVEAVTSTYYKAVADRVDDYALKLICSRLAKDEVKHYGLFKKKLDELRKRESISPLRLLKLSLSRLFEMEDEQVAYAYYLARNSGEPFDRKYHSRLMTRAAYSVYSKDRIVELVKLNFRTFGVSKSKLLNLIGYERASRLVAHFVYGYLQLRIGLLNHMIDFRRVRTILLAKGF
jgi:hypothetical protein